MIHIFSPCPQLFVIFTGPIVILHDDRHSLSILQRESNLQCKPVYNADQIYNVNCIDRIEWRDVLLRLAAKKATQECNSVFSMRRLSRAQGEPQAKACPRDLSGGSQRKPRNKVNTLSHCIWITNLISQCLIPAECHVQGTSGLFDSVGWRIRKTPFSAARSAEALKKLCRAVKGQKKFRCKSQFSDSVVNHEKSPEAGRMRSKSCDIVNCDCKTKGSFNLKES